MICPQYKEQTNKLLARKLPKVFLTGSGGFIGCAVQRAANRRGVSTVNIGQENIETLRALCAPGDTLLHLAWPNKPQSMSGYPRDDQAAWQTFVRWSVALRRAAAEADVGFIGIGSGIEAYLNTNLLSEAYRAYAQQKIELLDTLASAHSAPIAWLRLHFMFGEKEAPNRLIPAAIGACAHGKPFVCGSVARTRRWLHVDDVADCLLTATRGDKTAHWDIAGQEDVTFAELFHLITLAVGRPLHLAESKANTADDRLEAVRPVNMAPFVPELAGRRDNLLRRLTHYANSLMS